MTVPQSFEPSIPTHAEAPYVVVVSPATGDDGLGTTMVPVTDVHFAYKCLLSREREL